MAGSANGDSGVPHGALLSLLAEQVHERADLDPVRAQVIEALGPDGFVDAVAVCANFNMMVRIADGTGTPLDAGSVELSDGFRADLGLEDLTSRRLVTP
ncbi:MAG: hypothetical protein AAFN30_17050 [Actinomycetota bacterium]